MTAPFTGSFIPGGVFIIGGQPFPYSTSLSTFNGLNANGTWTLTITVDPGTNNSGKLLNYLKNDQKIDFPVDEWLYGAARVRPMLHSWESALMFDAARKGDGVSISVVRDTARYIGMAVANLVAIADPNIVILGGLIADAADQLLQPSRAEALRRLPKTMAESLTVTAATLGDDGGPLGAARAATLAR